MTPTAFASAFRGSQSRIHKNQHPQNISIKMTTFASISLSFVYTSLTNSRGKISCLRYIQFEIPELEVNRLFIGPDAYALKLRFLPKVKPEVCWTIEGRPGRSQLIVGNCCAHYEFALPSEQISRNPSICTCSASDPTKLCPLPWPTFKRFWNTQPHVNCVIFQANCTKFCATFHWIGSGLFTLDSSMKFFCPLMYDPFGQKIS